MGGNRARPQIGDLIEMIFGILGGNSDGWKNPAFMKATADRPVGDEAEWSVLAAGRNQMRFATLAVMRGVHVRVGLEDSLFIECGKLSTSSVEHVQKIRAIIEGLGVQTPAPAAALLGSLPAAEWMRADRGYDAEWFRDALENKGIRPCIPGRTLRGKAIRYDKRLYRRRNRIAIMFGRLKDRRRIATRYDRCAKAFPSAAALAETVIFWL